MYGSVTKLLTSMPETVVNKISDLKEKKDSVSGIFFYPDYVKKPCYNNGPISYRFI